MPEEKTASGTVAAVKPWQSGKGYFLSLMNDENDYYAFGLCKAMPDDGVVLTVKPGDGDFSDKVHITKLETGAKPAAPAKTPHEKGVDELHESIKNGKTAYFNKQNVIVEQCCLKAAAEIVSAMINNGMTTKREVIVENTLYMKDKFVEDILGTVEELEEPADEAGT